MCSRDQAVVLFKRLLSPSTSLHFPAVSCIRVKISVHPFSGWSINILLKCLASSKWYQITKVFDENFYEHLFLHCFAQWRSSVNAVFLLSRHEPTPETGTCCGLRVPSPKTWPLLPAFLPTSIPLPSLAPSPPSNSPINLEQKNAYKSHFLLPFHLYLHS